MTQIAVLPGDGIGPEVTAAAVRVLDKAHPGLTFVEAAVGAAAIATQGEPLPAESPLWKAPNLFITPHTSAISERLWPRETELLLKLLDEWFGGKEVSNRVDFSRGY